MGRPSSRQSDGSVTATLTTSVFEQLRQDILKGAIPPGEKLRIDALRERYGVGASPLREALNRLSAIHLVEQIEQKGFRVTLITREQLHELARTRCWITEIGVRESIASGDVAWEEEVVLANHRLRKHHENVSGPDMEWDDLHRRFHAALIAACPSHWIREFHETLFDLADRVRHLSVRNEHGARDVSAEHQEIADAVTARDSKKAIALLNLHFTRTAEIAALSLEMDRSHEGGAADLIDLGTARVRQGRSIQG